MKIPMLLSPLRRGPFRLLWAGMVASYAGDRLQKLAQASLRQLLMPLDGIVLDRFGVTGLIGGAAVLEILAVGVLSKVRRPVEP